MPARYVLPAQLVRTLLDAALAAGLNTLRMWSHGVTTTFSSQPSPGVYAEPVFRGLDYALDQARLRNIKVRGPACSDGCLAQVQHRHVC